MLWRDVGLRRILTDWLRDPVRRWHVLTRVVETVVPATLVICLVKILAAAGYTISWLGVWMLVWMILMGEWALYEFVLEPFFKAGPYWERGPRDGETFTRW